MQEGYQDLEKEAKDFENKMRTKIERGEADNFTEAGNLVVSDEAKERLTNEAEKMETDGFCREAPLIEFQADEEGRDNLIVRVPGTKKALGVKSSENEEREAITEHECLEDLIIILNKLLLSDGLLENQRESARDILENITFIGEKEYQEAVKAIAEVWKARLRENPNLLICAIAGEIARTSSEYDQQDSENGKQYKSDDWMLESVLECFTAEELKQFGERIIFDLSDIPDGAKSKDLSIILLDDWTISGSQLNNVFDDILREKPELESSIEIQLIAASEERIQNGLNSPSRETSIPVKAYIKAHQAKSAIHSRQSQKLNENNGSPFARIPNSGAIITGFHSSCDADFEFEISSMISNTHGENVSMPKLTNIVRPYRDSSWRPKQKDRVRTTS